MPVDGETIGEIMFRGNIVMKGIIISGGENMSSLEVEDALHRHPAVFAAVPASDYCLSQTRTR